MKYIAVIAVIAIVLLQYSGAVPQSSVGGPITLAIVFLGAAVAVGMHEAWTNKRGVLGWIVSVVVALVGAFVANEIGQWLFILTILLLDFLGLLWPMGLVSPVDPLYIGLAAMMLIMLLGSWIALQFMNRWR